MLKPYFSPRESWYWRRIRDACTPCFLSTFRIRVLRRSRERPEFETLVAHASHVLAGGIHAVRQRLITVANALAVFAALLIVWQLMLWIFHVPRYMLPSPWAVARAVVNRFPSLLASLAITAEESVGGLIASIVVGVLIALIFAQSRWVRRMLYPYTSCCRRCRSWPSRR